MLKGFQKSLNSVGWFKLLTTYDPYTYQARVLMDGHPIRLVKSGRQVGKSEMVSVEGLLKALLDDGSLVLIISATIRQARIIYDKIEGVLLRHRDLYSLVTSKNSEEVRFGNGSRIIIVPSAEGVTLRGFTPSLIIVDEAAYIKDRVFVALEPMMLHGARMIMVSSPFGQRGRFWELWNAPDESISKHSITCWDCVAEVADPVKRKLMVRHLEREKATKTESDFRQEYLGEFVTDEDTYFSRDLIVSCTSDEITEHHQAEEGRAYFLGVDLARMGGDESVYTVLATRDKTGEVVNIQSTAKKPLTDSMGRVQALHGAFGFERIYIDESGLGGGSVDFLKERNLPVEPITFTLKNKEELYKNLKLQMEKGALKFPDNPKLREQLANMQYDYTSTRLMRIHHPDRGHDDWSDALALACWGLHQKPFVFDWGDDYGEYKDDQGRTIRRI